MTQPIARIESRLRALDRDPKRDATGNSGRGRCPCQGHGKGDGDRNPSLTYGEFETGFGWVNCHAGCPKSSILDALSLTEEDLRPETPGSRREIEAYPYVDEQETLLFQVVRFEPKDFRQRRPDSQGGWQWNLEGVRRVLYRLPEVLAAVKAGKTIHVVEGEKDVHAGERAGAVATTCPMGAGKWRPEYSEALRGAHVVIVADADKTGRDHARAVATALEGIAASVRIVEAAVGKDMHDHLTAGKTLSELVPWAVEAITFPAPVAVEVPSTGPIEPADDWPSAIDPLAFHGLPGDFARLVAPHSEADEVALLVQFLVAVGNAIGLALYAQVEGDRHHTNLFTVLVGKTAHARKGTSWGRVRQPLRDVDERWAVDRVQSGLSSGEGLIWAVRDPIHKIEHRRGRNGSPGTYEDVVSDPGVADKRLLALEPEFASVLRVLQRDGNTLSAISRSAWDAAPVLQTLTKNSPAKATGAFISMVGHITRDEALRYLDRTELANGFANRFLWVCVRRARLLPEGGDLDPAVLSPLIEDLRRRVASARRSGRVTFAEPARQLWHASYSTLSGDRPGMFGAVTARAEAQSLRLALLYAILDGSDVIRLEHLRAAFGLWSYCEDSARYVFGVSLGEPVADDILRLLRPSPGGMTRTAIRDAFHRNRSGEQIERGLEVLHRNGLAYPKSVPTGGRPSELWLAAPTTETTDTTKGSGGTGHRSFRSFLSSLDLRALPPAPPLGTRRVLVEGTNSTTPTDELLPAADATAQSAPPGLAAVSQAEATIRRAIRADDEGTVWWAVAELAGHIGRDRADETEADLRADLRATADVG